MLLFKIRQKLGLTNRILEHKSDNLLQKWGAILAYLFNISKYIYFTRFGVRFYAHRDPFSFWLWRDTTNRLRLDEQVVEEILSPGDVCIDAGANIGLITLRAWKKVGPSGAVYSFEPHPLTYKRLLRNLKLNGYSTLYAKQVGVSDAKQKLRFTDLFISDLNSIDSEGSISISVDRLDVLVETNQKIKLLKIDVEGFELFALKGAEQLLSHTKYILVEIAPKSFEKNGYTTKDIIEFLENAGYESCALERGGIRTKIDTTFHPKDKYQDILAVKRG